MAAIPANIGGSMMPGPVLLACDSVPIDGTSGTHVGAPPGSILVDIANFAIFINTNTAASPTWRSKTPLHVAGVPTDGTSGTGVGCNKGTLCVDTTNGVLYINTNTAASPTWTKVGTQS